MYKQIKNYWNKINSQTDTDNEEFADATSENGVRASKFLGELNLDPIRPEINKYYAVKEGAETYPRKVIGGTENDNPYLENMMKFLIKKGFHDPVAMYFRND